MDIDVLCGEIRRICAEEPLSVRELATMFVSGSLVEGLGNPGSDVDVYVVLSPEQAPPARLVEHRGLRKHRIDFHYVGWEELALVAEQIATATASAVFREVTRDLAHRVRVGIPLSNEPRFRELQALFRFDLLVGHLFRRCVALLDWTLDDVWGMVDAGELDIAVLSAHTAVTHAASAYLLSLGETNSKQKWVGKLLGRLPRAGLHPRVEKGFWDLLLSGNSRADLPALRRHIDDCARYCNWVLEAAQG